MKKVVKLTESDLNRIVKRVMNEGRVMSIDYVPDEGWKGTWVVKGGILTLYNEQGEALGAYQKETTTN
jgi:hypothetical protein